MSGISRDVLIKMVNEAREFVYQCSGVGPDAEFADVPRKEIPVRDGYLNPVWIYRPADAPAGAKLPTFFNFHGGGFVMGIPQQDDEFCRRFEGTGIQVINCSYRLAPEYPYPQDHDDAYDTVLYIAEHADEFGVDPEKMAVGGHSAGANISTVLCMRAKRLGGFALRCQVLDYPPLDMAPEAFDKPQPEGCIPPEMAHMFDLAYRGEDLELAKDPELSPVYATKEDLEGLPPACVVTAFHDSLHFEGDEYARHLAEAGVPVEHRLFTGVCHGFTLQAYDQPDENGIVFPNDPAVREEACDMMIGFVKKYLL